MGRRSPSESRRMERTKVQEMRDSFFTECARVLNREPRTEIRIFSRKYISGVVDIIVRVVEDQGPNKRPYYIELPITAADVYAHGSEASYALILERLRTQLEKGKRHEPINVRNS